MYWKLLLLCGKDEIKGKTVGTVWKLLRGKKFYLSDIENAMLQKIEGLYQIIIQGIYRR